MRLFNLVFVILIAGGYSCPGQLCKTDAKYVGTKDSLVHTIMQDARKKLVALQNLIPGLAVDMRYATTQNFTKTILYYHPFACLRIEPAQALKRAQEELNNRGLALKIYDAYRPLSVTCKIWRLTADKHYVANPRKGSHHNRGLAIDVTLIDLRTGKELDMGTGYDNFTDSAHHDFIFLSPQVLANRKLLKSVMRKYGFGMVPTEWWHYQWLFNRSDYEVIDIDFDVLKDIVK